MIFFISIALASSLGIYAGKVKKNKKLLYTSLITLLVDVVLFVILASLYAIYE